MLYFRVGFLTRIILTLQCILLVHADFACNETHKKSSKSSYPSGEYDIRPNLFIDKDNLLGKTSRDHKKEFSYGSGPNGPSHWAKWFPKCGGKHQSPVNVDIPSLKPTVLPELKWENYDELPDKMTLSNTHNTLQLDIAYKFDKNPIIHGGPLQKQYAFKSLHFHWSNSDHKGAEHTVNKKTFPMEMHVVHYRVDMNFSHAVSQDKGLCVVAYIFEISNDKCNDAITNILSVADMASLEKDTPIELNNRFRLDSLVDKVATDYVTYPGSLTTPPCHESVVWIISPYTITIAKKQIEKFRSISNAANSFGDNYRPIQPLHERMISFVKSK